MSDLAEVKRLIEDQGRAWDEFKKANDELIKAKADGKAVGDLEAKVANLSAALDKIDEFKSNVEEAITAMQRPGGDKGEIDLATEVKAFNDQRQANAEKFVAPVDRDTFVSYKAAWSKFARKGFDALDSDERKAMLAGDDSNGGYLLPPAVTGRIVSKTFELSPIRQIVTVQPISVNALEGINDLDESSYGWVSEVGSRADTTTPTVGKYRIEAAEMYAAPKATQTLIDDSAVDIEMWLAMKVADKFARVEGAAFINGTGVGQPRGFATYTTAATADASRAWGTLEHVATSNSADFPSSNPGDTLFDLIAKFKSVYLQRAQWVTRREVIAKIRKFKEATTNAYMWQPGLQQGQPDRLLGYPIVNAQDIPTLAANSLSMWFGDWQAAVTVVDRIGMRTLRDPFTSKPYVIFYSTKRVGSGVVDFEAIKAVKFG